MMTNDRVKMQNEVEGVRPYRLKKLVGKDYQHRQLRKADATVHWKLEKKSKDV